MRSIACRRMFQKEAPLVRAGASFEAALRRLRHYGAAGGREVRIGLPTIQPRRSKMTYLVCPDTAAVNEYNTTHIACELSKVDWKLGVIVPGAKQMSRFVIKGRRSCGRDRKACCDPRQGGQGRPADGGLVLLRGGFRGSRRGSATAKAGRERGVRPAARRFRR